MYASYFTSFQYDFTQNSYLFARMEDLKQDEQIEQKSQILSKCWSNLSMSTLWTFESCDPGCITQAQWEIQRGGMTTLLIKKATQEASQKLGEIQPKVWYLDKIEKIWK